MYLSNLKLWNFRKYGSEKLQDDDTLDLNNPDLNLDFTPGLNVLIGENDSGKSAIIDAIKLVLKTHSYEWIRVDDEDFFNDSTRFRIELRFAELREHEAKNFIEWLGWEESQEDPRCYLRLIYEVQRNEERIFPSEVKAGVDEVGYPLSAEAREYLKITYLKPLRDAESELVPRRNSRLSQIFQSHAAFRGKDEEHYLSQVFVDFNEAIKLYFQGEDQNGKIDDQGGKDLKSDIDSYVQKFSGSDREAGIEVVHRGSFLKPILEKLELLMDGEVRPGLGTMNRLFMASELIHLDSRPVGGLQLGLIEELEAHLHPQAQMRVIEALQEGDEIQLILTTHSPNLASKVQLKNLIICKGKKAFPLGPHYTQLEYKEDKPDDYQFLERFLDVTKANLFFAKGVIMVEGWSEEIILPALAKKMKYQGMINRDLTEAGVSIINIGNLAFGRYSKIFVRKDGTTIGVPVAIVTDADVPTYVKEDNGSKTVRKREKEKIEQESESRKSELRDKFEIDSCKDIQAFISHRWTLEYCLFKSESLSKIFQAVLKEVHPKIDGDNLEPSLAEKLINKSLNKNKTEIAYRLAQKLEDGQHEPEVELSECDEYLGYLIEAIKHVCQD